MGSVMHKVEHSDWRKYMDKLVENRVHIHTLNHGELGTPIQRFYCGGEQVAYYAWSESTGMGYYLSESALASINPRTSRTEMICDLLSEVESWNRTDLLEAVLDYKEAELLKCSDEQVKEQWNNI